MKNLFTIPVFAYIALVVLVNVLFSVVPMIETPIGLLSPVAIIVGAVFVVRDYAQRRAQHLVIVAMLIATVISYLMADPFVAVASALAFFTSEMFDWLLYTVTKKPFHHRVLISSLFSTPVDTAVFLLWINDMSVGTFALMVASKLIAAVVIYGYYSQRPTYANA
jgi:uncharacterized PurR-regulated membrane protein YhhQ (DUF165 family)